MTQVQRQRIVCSKCTKPFRVKAELAGRRVKCPMCDTRLLVPKEATGEECPQAANASEAPPSGKSDKELLAEILGAFRRPFEGVRVSFTYRLMLLLVAGLALLILGIYLATIAAVGYFGYYHATHHYGLLFIPFRYIRLGGIFLYGAPLIAAFGVIVALVKPMLARPASSSSGVKLKPQDAPMLFALVDHLARCIDAPLPTRIEVDCNVNASASYATGWWNMVRGGDFTLKVGLPLIGGLTLRQLAGIVAHELGHFRQGTGTRVRYFALSIHWWLLMAGYHRDSWDETLAEHREDGNWFAEIFVILTWPCIALVRVFFRMLAFFSTLVISGMARQMEYDADQYEIHVSGSKTFGRTCRKLHELELALELVARQLRSSEHEFAALRDLPVRIVNEAKDLPAHEIKRVHAYMAGDNHGWFDLHPSPKHRIARAMAEEAPGILRSTLPASVLVKNFDKLSKRATDKMMRELLLGFV
ncbi:Protease HtpX [Planctomycetes bacterium Pan216]|uniref:Protease HtpX n=1 Tax=Kolteria novifilia TaxID=2527975 RepID=A0A518B8H2_9BACT|nr:Protease HtpX [Planctomycetes bacterium Pan216]